MYDDDIAGTIAGRVRAGRARIGMTRKQLAAAAGVSERYLNELENGSANASVGILLKISRALGRDFIELVTTVTAALPTGAADAAVETHVDLASLVAGMTRDEQRTALPVLRRWLAEHRRGVRGIALLGLRGAGKSTLGARFAAGHGLPFVSITREIESRAGMSLADLFNLGGPDAYRALENDVVGDLARRRDRVVLETAGGIVDNRTALDVILSAFATVWLKASPEEHLARVAAQGDTRPMRGDPRALEHLKGLLARREAEYARAEYCIDTSGRAVDACLVDLERIASPLLKARAD